MRTNRLEGEIKDTLEEGTFDLGLMVEHELFIQVEKVQMFDYTLSANVLYDNLNI